MSYIKGGSHRCVEIAPNTPGEKVSDPAASSFVDLDLD